MDMHVQDKGVYAFDGFLLDPARRTLRRGDVAITLRPRLFDVLVYLVENSGRVIHRDELLANVWGGRVVVEGNINQSIFGLRKTLRLHGDVKGCINTAPSRGYRFVAPVSRHAGPYGAVTPVARTATSVGGGLAGRSGITSGMTSAWRKLRHALYPNLPSSRDDFRSHADTLGLASHCLPTWSAFRQVIYS